MSYDLYFYKRKDSPITKADISNYLSAIPDISNEDHVDQWWYQNADTDVYFSFEYDEPSLDEDDMEDFEGFENTNFMFNINFLRPDFFGLEAFPVVTKLITDLNLFVLNPQFGAEADHPHKPSEGNLYKGWSEFNLKTSIDHFDQGTGYYPLERTNEIWEYNFKRKTLQEGLGTDYFVPRIFYFKTKANARVVTVAVWAEHIPNVMPVADYYIISRTRRKLFRKVKESGFISYNTLLNLFGSYFEDFSFKDCKIIHPIDAEKAAKIFNSMKFEEEFEAFAKRMSMDNLYNSKPD